MKNICKGDLFSSSDGEFEVLDYGGSKSVLIRFITTGFVTLKTSTAVRSGRVKDKMLPKIYGVAFMGDGKYRPTKSGVVTEAYSKWKSMLQRCFDRKFQQRCGTYLGCTVCDEWLNFQVFAEWYYSSKSINIESPQLDKDIKKPGNLHYCPELCSVVSRRDNSMEANSRTKAKEYIMKNPSGVVVLIHNMNKFCKINKLDVGCLHAVWSGKRNSHKGWTAL